MVCSQQFWKHDVESHGLVLTHPNLHTIQSLSVPPHPSDPSAVLVDFESLRNCLDFENCRAGRPPGGLPKRCNSIHLQLSNGLQHWTHSSLKNPWWDRLTSMFFFCHTRKCDKRTTLTCTLPMCSAEFYWGKNLVLQLQKKRIKLVKGNFSQPLENIK